MKLIRLVEGEDKRTHFFGELYRVDKGTFMVNVYGQAVRDGPTEIRIEAESWSSATQEVGKRLYVMRAMVQRELGVEVVLPDELKELEGKLGQMLAILEGVDNIGRN